MNSKEEVILLPHEVYFKLISCYPYVYFKERRIDNYMPAIYSNIAVHMFSIILCNIISLYAVSFIAFILSSAALQK